MKKAAEEAQDKTLNIPTKQRVTIDGSWQKRGFTSLNGVVTAVVDNKIIDTKAFSKHCKGCSMWKKIEDHQPTTDGKQITYVTLTIQSHLVRWKQLVHWKSFLDQLKNTILFIMNT